MKKHIINIIGFILLLFIFMYVHKQSTNVSVILDIANANLRTSNLLSEYSRNYVLTGDPIYKEKYIEIVNIRDGDGSWDIFYKNPWFEGRTETLFELYNMFSLDTDGLKYLEKSLQDSIDLEWKEITAMNFYDGLIDPLGSSKAKFESHNDNLITDIKFPVSYLDATPEQITVFIQEYTDDVLKEDENVKDLFNLEFLKNLAVNELYDAKYIRTSQKIFEIGQNAVQIIMRSVQNKVDTLWYVYIIIIFVFIMYNIYVLYHEKYPPVL